jgi:nucleotide-binding universal stress UspA family protein
MKTLAPEQRVTRSQSSIRKILVALDLTVRSEATAEYAAYVAKSFGAWLKLVHVHSPETVYNVISNEGYDLIDTEQRNRRHALRALTKRISKRYRFCSQAFLVGNPAEEIALFARQINADLIIVGGYHPTFLASILHLDQAPKLIHQAHCPVLVFQEATVLA